MKRETVEEIVRRAILSSQMSRYEISKQSGVPESMLSRFVAGSHGMTLQTLEKLRDVLHLEIRIRS